MLRRSPGPRGWSGGVLIRLLFILLLKIRNHPYSWRISLFKHSVCLLAEERRANYSIFYCLFFSKFATADFFFGWVDGLGGVGGWFQGDSAKSDSSKASAQTGKFSELRMVLLLTSVSEPLHHDAFMFQENWRSKIRVFFLFLP